MKNQPIGGDQSSNDTSSMEITQIKNRTKNKSNKNKKKNYQNLVSDDESDNDDSQPPKKKRKLNSDAFEAFKDDILTGVSQNSDILNKRFERMENLIKSTKNDNNSNNNLKKNLSPSKHSVEALQNCTDRGNGRFNGEYIIHSENKIFKLIHEDLVNESMNVNKDKLIEDLLNNTNKGAVATVQGK